MPRYAHKLLAFLVLFVLLLPSQRVTSSETDAGTNRDVYLPLVMKNYPPVILTDIWVGNSDGYRRSAFLAREEIRYITVGENLADSPYEVTLNWRQDGPCGTTQIFSGTMMLEPGLWVNSLAESAPDCLGSYTNTVQLTYDTYTETWLTAFDVVTYTSEITVSNHQGFDKCALPSVSQMQTWWQHSPYWVFNIYLGGSSLACDNPDLTADWVWQVSQQGWTFILTWVGPQSPCFNTTKPKISPDPEVAIQQGRDEADLAIAAAEALDLYGDKVIYYDLEGYTDNGACRAPVDAFITGWTERLHENGVNAGAYGSPCRSYITDWWDNTPLLDDIWIAWWTHTSYDPDVTVFEREGCGLINEMWGDNRRLWQYAGGHYETWGGENLNGTIDSDVLLGQVTAISTTTQTVTTRSPQIVPLGAAIPLRDAELLPGGDGWALQGNRILWRSGTTGIWDDITPANISTILDAAFPDPVHGFLITQTPDAALTLYRTKDGGETWRSAPLPYVAVDVGAAYLEFVDAQTGWIALKMASSSAFSIGRLFATVDGGQTWEERMLPLGEPVQFSDALHGLVSGGPMGDELYCTTDGGHTWAAADEQACQNAASQPQLAGWPQNTDKHSQTDAKNAWALTRNGSCGGYLPLGDSTPLDGTAPLPCVLETHLWMTADGGKTWMEITP